MIPKNQKIWHITHINNLPGILEQGVLWSDAKRLALGFDCEIVGMSKIKQRRLQQLTVDCHLLTRVGDYVPFYFCPRSVMLYILYKGDSPDLHYKGGQEPMVHLQVDLERVIAWAESSSIRWAFSDRNAGASLATFSCDKNELTGLDWRAIENPDFRNANVKEGKQAEFLIHESFPWELVEEIGVLNSKIAGDVKAKIATAQHQPKITVRRDWYF